MFFCYNFSIRKWYHLKSFDGTFTLHRQYHECWRNEPDHQQTLDTRIASYLGITVVLLRSINTHACVLALIIVSSQFCTDIIWKYLALNSYNRINFVIVNTRIVIGGRWFMKSTQCVQVSFIINFNNGGCDGHKALFNIWDHKYYISTTTYLGYTTGTTSRWL